ncbi:MAG: ATP-binding protein, partial [Actinomycetota bacterium]|nr:ATP-binding protein [Actinomycetota bacterium]
MQELIISVASGKGGTGKTTVAVALAISSQYCQFIDYDVEAPNADIFLKPEIRNIKKVTIKQPYFLTDTGKDFSECVRFCHYNAVAAIGSEVIFFSELCHGCGGCMLVGPEGAVREKDVEVGKISKGFSSPGIDFLKGNLMPGSMRTTTIQAELEKMINKKDTVIIDSPPGNSCSMVMSVKNSDYCILVTEPTPYGFNDLLISMEVLDSLKIPYGVIINRDGIGDSSVSDYCKDKNIKIHIKIPNDVQIAKCYSNGGTLIDYDQSYRSKFENILK